MRMRHGKHIARWTGSDGKRHEKACDTAREAKQVQRDGVRERLAKKIQALLPAPSRKSRRSGRRAAAGPSTESSPKK